MPIETGNFPERENIGVTPNSAENSSKLSGVAERAKMIDDATLDPLVNRNTLRQAIFALKKGGKIKKNGMIEVMVDMPGDGTLKHVEHEISVMQVLKHLNAEGENKGLTMSLLEKLRGLKKGNEYVPYVLSMPALDAEVARDEVMRYVKGESTVFDEDAELLESLIIKVGESRQSGTTLEQRVVDQAKALQAQGATTGEIAERVTSVMQTIEVVDEYIKEEAEATEYASNYGEGMKEVEGGVAIGETREELVASEEEIQNARRGERLVLGDSELLFTPASRKALVAIYKRIPALAHLPKIKNGTYTATDIHELEKIVGDAGSHGLFVGRMKQYAPEMYEKMKAPYRGLKNMPYELKMEKIRLGCAQFVVGAMAMDLNAQHLTIMSEAGYEYSGASKGRISITLDKNHVPKLTWSGGSNPLETQMIEDKELYVRYIQDLQAIHETYEGMGLEDAIKANGEYTKQLMDILGDEIDLTSEEGQQHYKDAVWSYEAHGKYMEEMQMKYDKMSEDTTGYTQEEIDEVNTMMYDGIDTPQAKELIEKKGISMYWLEVMREKISPLIALQNSELGVSMQRYGPLLESFSASVKKTDYVGGRNSAAIKRYEKYMTACKRSGFIETYQSNKAISTALTDHANNLGDDNQKLFPNIREEVQQYEQYQQKVDAIYFALGMVPNGVAIKTGVSLRNGFIETTSGLGVDVWLAFTSLWRDRETMMAKYARRDEFISSFKVDVSTAMKAPFKTEDDKWNIGVENVLNRAGEALPQFYMLIGTAGIISTRLGATMFQGVRLSTSNLPLITSSMMMTFPRYYKTGIQHGMSKGDALMYGLLQSGVTSLLETVVPMKPLRQSPVSGMAISNTKHIKSFLMRNVPVEVGEENMQHIAELMINVASNPKTKKALDTDFSWNDLAGLSMVTVLVAGLGGSDIMIKQLESGRAKMTEQFEEVIEALQNKFDIGRERLGKLVGVLKDVVQDKNQKTMFTLLEEYLNNKVLNPIVEEENNEEVVDTKEGIILEGSLKGLPEGFGRSDVLKNMQISNREDFKVVARSLLNYMKIKGLTDAQYEKIYDVLRHAHTNFNTRIKNEYIAEAEEEGIEIEKMDRTEIGLEFEHIVRKLGEFVFIDADTGILIAKLSMRSGLCSQYEQESNNETVAQSLIQNIIGTYASGGLNAITPNQMDALVIFMKANASPRDNGFIIKNSELSSLISKHVAYFQRYYPEFFEQYSSIIRLSDHDTHTIIAHKLSVYLTEQLFDSRENETTDISSIIKNPQSFEIQLNNFIYNTNLSINERRAIQSGSFKVDQRIEVIMDYSLGIDEEAQLDDISIETQQLNIVLNQIKNILKRSPQEAKSRIQTTTGTSALRDLVMIAGKSTTNNSLLSQLEMKLGLGLGEGYFIPLKNLALEHLATLEEGGSSTLYAGLLQAIQQRSELGLDSKVFNQMLQSLLSDSMYLENEFMYDEGSQAGESALLFFDILGFILETGEDIEVTKVQDLFEFDFPKNTNDQSYSDFRYWVFCQITGIPFDSSKPYQKQIDSLTKENSKLVSFYNFDISSSEGDIDSDIRNSFVGGLLSVLKQQLDQGVSFEEVTENSENLNKYKYQLQDKFGELQPQEQHQTIVETYDMLFDTDPATADGFTRSTGIQYYNLKSRTQQFLEKYFSSGENNYKQRFLRGSDIEISDIAYLYLQAKLLDNTAVARAFLLLLKPKVKEQVMKYTDMIIHLLGGEALAHSIVEDSKRPKYTGDYKKTIESLQKQVEDKGATKYIKQLGIPLFSKKTDLYEHFNNYEDFNNIDDIAGYIASTSYIIRILRLEGILGEDYSNQLSEYFAQWAKNPSFDIDSEIQSHFSQKPKVYKKIIALGFMDTPPIFDISTVEDQDIEALLRSIAKSDTLQGMSGVEVRKYLDEIGITAQTILSKANYLQEFWELLPEDLHVQDIYPNLVDAIKNDYTPNERLSIVQIIFNDALIKINSPMFKGILDVHNSDLTIIKKSGKLHEIIQEYNPELTEQERIRIVRQLMEFGVCGRRQLEIGNERGNTLNEWIQHSMKDIFTSRKKLKERSRILSTLEQTFENLDIKDLYLTKEETIGLIYKLTAHYKNNGIQQGDTESYIIDVITTLQYNHTAQDPYTDMFTSRGDSRTKIKESYEEILKQDNLIQLTKDFESSKSSDELILSADGFSIYKLTSQQGFIDESKELKHCIGGKKGGRENDAYYNQYRDDYLLGDNSIYSIRGKSGRLMTIEITSSGVLSQIDIGTDKRNTFDENTYLENTKGVVNILNSLINKGILDTNSLNLGVLREVLNSNMALLLSDNGEIIVYSDIIQALENGDIELGDLNDSINECVVNFNIDETISTSLLNKLLDTQDIDLDLTNLDTSRKNEIVSIKGSLIDYSHSAEYSSLINISGDLDIALASNKSGLHTFESLEYVGGNISTNSRKVILPSLNHCGGIITNNNTFVFEAKRLKEVSGGNGKLSFSEYIHEILLGDKELFYKINKSSLLDPRFVSINFSNENIAGEVHQYESLRNKLFESLSEEVRGQKGFRDNNKQFLKEAIIETINNNFPNNSYLIDNSIYGGIVKHILSIEDTDLGNSLRIQLASYFLGVPMNTEQIEAIVQAHKNVTNKGTIRALRNNNIFTVEQTTILVELGICGSNAKDTENTESNGNEISEYVYNYLINHNSIDLTNTDDQELAAEYESQIKDLIVLITGFLSVPKVSPEQQKEIMREGLFRLIQQRNNDNQLNLSQIDATNIADAVIPFIQGQPLDGYYSNFNTLVQEYKKLGVESAQYLLIQYPEFLYKIDAFRKIREQFPNASLEFVDSGNNGAIFIIDKNQVCKIFYLSDQFEITKEASNQDHFYQALQRFKKLNPEIGNRMSIPHIDIMNQPDGSLIMERVHGKTLLYYGLLDAFSESDLTDLRSFIEKNKDTSHIAKHVLSKIGNTSSDSEILSLITASDISGILFLKEQLGTLQKTFGVHKSLEGFLYYLNSRQTKKMGLEALGRVMELRGVTFNHEVYSDWLSKYEEYARTQGLIHQDFHFGNVMISIQGGEIILHIIDFGDVKINYKTLKKAEEANRILERRENIEGVESGPLTKDSTAFSLILFELYRIISKSDALGDSIDTQGQQKLIDTITNTIKTLSNIKPREYLINHKEFGPVVDSILAIEESDGGLQSRVALAGFFLGVPINQDQKDAIENAHKLEDNVATIRALTNNNNFTLQQATILVELGICGTVKLN